MDQIMPTDFETAPGLGHNHPPVPITPDEIKRHLLAEHTALMTRRDQLVQAVAAFLDRYPQIETGDQASAAVQQLDMIAKHKARVEECRSAEKKPYWDAGRAVDAWFKALDADLAEAHAQLNAPATAFADKIAEQNHKAAKAEAARLAAEAEAAEQQARVTGDYDTAIAVAQQAEAAAELASAKPAAHSRITGTYGSTGSLRVRWVHRVTDPAKVERHLCMPSDALIRAAIAAGLRESPGLEIYEDKKLATRS